MQVGKDTVVSISYELCDAEGKLIEKTSSPVSYLHGGYEGMFLRVESALEGKHVGAQCEVQLEPTDAFGEYDSELVRMEPRDRFPANISVGMQFEGAPEGSNEFVIYTVTDVVDDQIVVDGNHPLAGRALVFSCTVMDVRAATSKELTHGHVHGPNDHHH